MQIDYFGNTFILGFEKVLYWKEKSVLVISDVHLGKVMHFRKSGIDIPTNPIAENFERLNVVIEKFNPDTIVFLGDLFHSELNMEWDLFVEFMKSYSDKKVYLAIGNHDIIPEIEFEKTGIICQEEIEMDNVVFTHYEKGIKEDSMVNLAGHIHPAVKLQIGPKDFFRVPCFYRKRSTLILPAFGAFTGMKTISPRRGEQAYAIVENNVLKV